MNPLAATAAISRRPARRLRWAAASLCVIALCAMLARWLVPAIPAQTFGFLWQSTGWDIGFSALPYNSQDPYWWTFLVGFCNTIMAGAIAVVLSTVLGFLVGLGRLSSNALIADLAALLVNVVRNIPVVLQIMIWYTLCLNLPSARQSYHLADWVFLSNRGVFIPCFAEGFVALSWVLPFVVGSGVGAILLWRLAAGLRWRDNRDKLLPPMLLAAACLVALAASAVQWPHALAIDWPVNAGLNFRGGLRLPPEFVALIAAITLYRSTFIGEIFRAGLSAVSKGQVDAAHSLGLKPWVILLKIRVPLALVSIMPPISNEYIVIVKITSIGIAVGFMDLFAVSSNSSMMTGHTIEVLIVMTLFYIVLNYAIATVMNLFNRQVQIVGMGEKR